jgi:hypothetical protein
MRNRGHALAQSPAKANFAGTCTLMPLRRGRVRKHNLKGLEEANLRWRI